MAMKKNFLLIVVFASLCIGIMGLKPRRQGHDLVNGKMDLNMGHDLNNGLQQHKINNHKEYDKDTYEQQTTPDDSESSTTSSINHDGTTYHKKSLLKSQLQHKLFSDDQSTTGDSYGHYATASEMSSYDHYYGNKGHKFGNNLNNNQHDNHDQYSHDMYDNHNNYDANHDSYDSHHLKQQAHKQNDLDQPNKGQRRYYVDDSSLRQGLRQQDTSSVKVRDYVDYNKQLAGKPISGNTIINRHSLGDIDSSSASSVSHHDKVFYQHNKLNHNDEESTSQSSQSIQLHDPNDDQYIISHKKAKQITHQQGVHQEEVHDATGNVELPQESHQFTTSTTSLPEHNNKQATTYHDTSSPTN